MKIDIHRHAEDPGTAQRVIRNLFHNQASEIGREGYYSIGLHPWQVKEESLESDIDLVRQAAEKSQVVAIGEAGLDKSISTPFQLQEQAFLAQIDIARAFNKPLIIHCVRAYNEIFSLKLKSLHEKPWVIHWFNASQQMGEQLISKNFYLSFGHMLFNVNSKAYHAFPRLSEDRIFFETDDAGVTIDEVYEQASALRRKVTTSLEKRIEMNFMNCFEVVP
jgi:TatD DNase family protein